MSPLPAQTSESESSHHLAKEQERIARIDAWLDGLISDGCPPPDDYGSPLPELEVGGLPEDPWTLYDLYDFEDDGGDHRIYRW